MSKENWLSEVQKEYPSLEYFLKEREDMGAEPLLFGYAPFNYLWEKELLQKEDIIRTNLQMGGRDAHYVITEEGKLKGIEAAKGLYSGDPGIHHPKKILNIGNADNGWTIGFFAKARIRISLEEQSL